MGAVRKKDFNIVSYSLLTVFLITDIVLIPRVPNHLGNGTEHQNGGVGATAPLYPPKIDARDERFFFSLHLRDRARSKTGYFFSSGSILSMPTDTRDF